MSARLHTQYLEFQSLLIYNSVLSVHLFTLKLQPVNIRLNVDIQIKIRIGFFMLTPLTLNNVYSHFVKEKTTLLSNFTNSSLHYPASLVVI